MPSPNKTTALHELTLAAGGIGTFDWDLPARLLQGEPHDDVALLVVRPHLQDRPRPVGAAPIDVPPNVPPDPAGT